MNRLTLLLFLLLSACASSPPPPSVIQQPLSVRPPQPSPLDKPYPGAIYNTSAKSLFLFNDRRDLRVGDLLTIVMEENLSASHASNTDASREGKVSAAGSFGGSVPLLPGVLTSMLGINGAVDDKTQHTATGAAGATNTFSGTITVTVNEVLPNSNLVVSGEKQIAINSEVQYLRFSGVVNPLDVVSGNIVSSLKIADARMEQRGSGAVADAQTMGWLGRFFLKFAPF